MTYANRLRAAREREGLTQREVADRLGVCSTSVHQWEYERSRPTRAHAEAIRKLLGVDPPEGKPPSKEEPDLGLTPSDQRVVEEAARCCIAVAKSQGSYHGTTADDLVTAHVGADSPRWSPLMTRVRNRARELEGRVFSCQSRTLGEESEA